MLVSEKFSAFFVHPIVCVVLFLSFFVNWGVNLCGNGSFCFLGL